MKESLPEEYGLFHQGQVLFTFSHLAADKTLTDALLKSEMVGIAYETVQKSDGYLPLLAARSEIVGRISPLIGSFYLAKHKGGSGKFIGGVPGVKALGEDKALARGLNLFKGKVTCEAISKAHSLPYYPGEEVRG